MRFFSYQFPNITIRGGNKQIKFENGVYITDDEDEIKLLKDMGFRYIENKPKPTKRPAKKEYHNIPKRWTKKQIEKYAKEYNIKIPKDVTTKAEMREFINSIPKEG